MQERGLAARLLPLLDKACLDNEESSEEQTRLVNCLKEAVTMEAARSKLRNETSKTIFFWEISPKSIYPPTPGFL